MTSDSPPTDPSSTQDEFPSGLGLVWVVIYVTADRLWLYMGPRFGHFFTEPLDAGILIASALFLWRSGRAREIKAYFVGHWWPRRGRRIWIALLPIATIGWFVLWEFYQPSNPAKMTALRFIDDTITSPLTEEPLFRGLILAILLRHVRTWRVLMILLSAVLFASIHGPKSWEHLVTLTGVGVIWGGGYVLTRCVPLCVLCHAMWNAMTYCPFLHNLWPT